MLTKEEQHQLHLFCEKDEHLADLIKKMEASHRMNLPRISHEIRNPVTLINSFSSLCTNTDILKSCNLQAGLPLWKTCTICETFWKKYQLLIILRFFTRNRVHSQNFWNPS